jgi:putative MATE family efflux protein
MSKYDKTTLIPTTQDVFNLAWPLALKAIMLHGIILIDAYLVSSLGEEALAATGVAGSICGILMGMNFAFSSATQIRIAQAFGSADPVALKTGFYCGLLINLSVTLVGLIILLFVSGDLVHYFSHTPWIAEQAMKYLSVFTIVIVCQSINGCLSSHFNGCGKSKVPFYGFLISVPLNIILSVIFIQGLLGFPAMGVQGAALGSAISSFVQLLYLTLRFYQIERAYVGVRGWLRGTLLASLYRHFVFSLPIAATFISSSLAQNVCGLIYAKMDVIAFAAITLVTPWIVVAGTIGISWAQATGIIIGQLLGKDIDGKEVDKFLSRSWRFGFVASSLVSVGYLAVCLLSVWLYAGLQDVTRAAFIGFLPILLLLPFPKGSNAICGNTLRAGGDTVYVMKIFLWSNWGVRVPLTAILVLYFDVSVFWVFSVLLLEELVKFPAFHMRLFKGHWKRNLNN